MLSSFFTRFLGLFRMPFSVGFTGAAYSVMLSSLSVLKYLISTTPRMMTTTAISARTVILDKSNISCIRIFFFRILTHHEFKSIMSVHLNGLFRTPSAPWEHSPEGSGTVL
ncbi:hypothetical protein ATCV1_z620R [Acanthocystis turfacea chlorella virus 1]|uniref:Uncharacterized protein z620R n=1 Tax=Chlorovirus heliozoae TaxID=322019 RepID=A7K9N0_9PHYC|nr:hypothetical protein ATCV1_z620R [Acanthocystis turfacea chlorella virus 1]ABT16754.1 hypothetical protein ATCV1_z620R [Acanthocystis turfacea chlorella virus 1]